MAVGVKLFAAPLLLPLCRADKAEPFCTAWAYEKGAMALWRKVMRVNWLAKFMEVASLKGVKESLQDLEAFFWVGIQYATALLSRTAPIVE